MPSAIERSRDRAHDGTFEALYRAHVRDVLCWLRAFGVPAAEREDVAQEVFLVVRRKLPSFDGAQPRGWLFRIAQRTASDHRRRAWFKSLWRRREPEALDHVEWSGPDPARALEQRQAQGRIAAVLAQMSPHQRTAFVLFEIEGYEGEEIAQLLGVPVGTVWRRLFDARARFTTLAARLNEGEVTR